MDKMRSMKDTIEQKMAEFQQSVSKRTEQSSWAGDFSARLTETKEQLENYRKLKRPGHHKTGRMFRGSQLNQATDRSMQAIEEALAELKRKLHRHVNILNACFFESSVQLILDVFPDGIAGRLDHHAALYACVIAKLCLFY